MRIGFRNWKLKIGKGGRYELYPVAQEQLGSWDLEGVNESKDCSQTPELEHPNINCYCGFYHYYELSRISYDGVRGAVVCWGKTVGHGKEGFRSRYGKIIGLIRPDISVYPQVPIPVPSEELLKNLWMIHPDYSDLSLEEFHKVLVMLHGKHPVLPANINWRVPNEEEIRNIYERMQRQVKRIKGLDEEWKSLVTQYSEKLKTHEKDCYRKFEEDISIPIFPDIEGLMRFVKEFGAEVGPPKKI